MLDDLREHRMNTTEMNYSTISPSCLPANMKAEVMLFTNYLWVLLRNPLPTQKTERVPLKRSHAWNKLCQQSK